MTAAPAAPVPVSRRELLWTLVERQLRLRSKRSVMGVVWPVTAPLFLLALYTFVFGSVFDAPVEDYAVYLFAGLLPWTFLVQTSHDALQSISFEPELVRRAPMPYHFLPLARVVVLALPFGVLLAGFLVWLAVSRELRLVMLPVLALSLVALVLFVAAVAMVLALVDVYTRDLRYVLTNLFTVWFFLVPIVYDERMVGTPLRALAWADPMHMHVRLFHDALYAGRLDHPGQLLVAPVASAALFAAAIRLYRRTAGELPKEV